MGILEDIERQRNLMNAQAQANKAQANYDTLMPQAMAKLNQAQSRTTNPLEAVLSGIGSSISNVGDTLYNIAGGGIASIRDLASGNAGKRKYQKEWEARRKKELGDENMSDKDYYAKTAGKALDAAATVSDLIPGLGTAAKVGLNVGQGVASGVAQNYIDNGANVSLEDAIKGGLVGGAGAAAGQYVGGKLAGKAGNGKLSKLLYSNVGKGALTGAASGATGGGLNAALNGGDLLSGALQGAQGGALAGGTMAGTMGLIGSGLNRLNNKVKPTVQAQTPEVETPTKPITQEVAEQYVKQPTRRNIPITDYDAGEQAVRVNRANRGDNYTLRRSADTSDIKVSPNLDPSQVAALERQLTVNRQKQGAALLEQYGTLDAPVRRAVGSPEDVLTTLYDNYGLKSPADVQYAANHVTGKNGIVSQMTRELASSAKNVDTTITRDWLQELMDNNGLLDDEQKTVTKQIAGALKRANASSDGSTTLDIMKQLEKQSARYKGKDGTYHHATESESRKGLIIDLVHDELQDRLWDAAGDPKKVLTSERLAELKNMYKDNNAWANFIDNGLAKVTDGAQLRNAMKPLVDGSKIVNGSKMSAGGYGERALRAGTAANAKVALTQVGLDMLLNSDKAKQRKAEKYAKSAAKAQAQLTGQEVPKTTKTSQGMLDGIKNKASNAANALNNETFSNARLGGNVGENYNLPSFGELATRQLARQAGLGAARAQNNQAMLDQATEEAQGIQNNYENAMQQAQQAYALAQQQAAQSTDTSMLDRIAKGMENALAAGDISAYGELADLYKQAYNIYSLQNPETTAKSSAAKDLSVNQAKAYAGLQQLSDLSQMSPDLGTALASTPAGGIINLLGGNEYANQAKALATTIGYLLSGANIRETEAERIGQAYVPSAFDSDQVKQDKLSRAEQLLRSYLSDTSALQ